MFLFRIIALILLLIFGGALIFTFIGHKVKFTYENLSCPTEAEAANDGGGLAISKKSFKIPKYPPALLDAEAEASWDQPIWFGLITAEEKTRANCGDGVGKCVYVFSVFFIINICIIYT